MIMIFACTVSRMLVCMYMCEPVLYMFVLLIMCACVRVCVWWCANFGQDDKRLEDVNIQERINLFVNESLEQVRGGAKALCMFYFTRCVWCLRLTIYFHNIHTCSPQAEVYRTNNIMLTMGADFKYQNANTWFKNMVKKLFD